ncbi:MAG: winged helix-turn-helix domain-containing protein, partial [Actinomycetota bacterium]|nr:winged helix-turn-helix domain-containing protein [Actinomycetota bacterium]
MAETAVPDPIHVRFEQFELDQGNARLSKAGSPIALAPTPFELLCALARQPGTLLTKHKLLDGVWGHRFVSDSVLKGAISDIRTALGDDPRNPRFIETVPRRGYRFVGRLAVAPTTHAPDGTALQRSFEAAALEESNDAEFVGRGQELSRLQRAWDRASSG